MTPPGGGDRLLRMSSPAPPSPPAPASPREPLAERMRPRTLEEFVGQSHILGPDKPLRLLLDSGHLPSIIFWGPPGCGKSSLARIISQRMGYSFHFFSAVISGIRELKDLFARLESETTEKNLVSSTRSTGSTRPSRTRFSRTSKKGSSPSSAQRP